MRAYKASIGIIVIAIGIAAYISIALRERHLARQHSEMKNQAPPIFSGSSHPNAVAATPPPSHKNSAATVPQPTRSQEPGLTTPPPPFGERTIATVTNGAEKQTLTVDQMGHFPRVYIQPRQTVPVQVHFPEAEPGEVAVVRVEDGGHLENGVPSRVAKLDTDKNIDFTFQANADLGVYHVIIHKGDEDRVLDFWAGPETPLANR